jgi:hypothetical protein
MSAPNLLNDDGNASFATALMMSHHGFRRDLARFARALQALAGGGDNGKVAALREEWRRYRDAIHGHHTAEDQGVFPQLRGQQPSLAATLDQLSADHRRIDPLLERGDRAFAQLPATAEAAAVVAELSSLLDPHLAIEEAQVVPHLREARQFPPPTTEAELQLYADGFAWACDGVAPEVVERLYAMLPESLTSRLPAARAAYEARSQGVWGASAPGRSRTAIPDWLPGG